MKISLNSISKNWRGSVLREESTLHQLSPYLGKMKSSMANSLVSAFTSKGDNIYDPFCGSGTIALESWASGRNIIANDLSPYAFTLTRAKLYPHYSIDDTNAEIEDIAKQVSLYISKVDLRHIPMWVRSYFHPETLREIIAWFQVLKLKKSYFLLSCLLGILHHQRPGFLSYPCSHTVPYKREKNFPREDFPELYQYRPVRERLEKKVARALKRVPHFDNDLIRMCNRYDAAKHIPKQKVNAIITSPPYMRQLDYARDNRLRLWFLGERDWKSLDSVISPAEADFISLFRRCLSQWKNVLIRRGLCVLVLGDTRSRLYNMLLPDVVAHIATKEVGGYSVCWKHTEAIPNERRVRRGCFGSLTETILVLRKN
ncbi:MAG: DNA adenine methylase [Deltaproteobacteria bacterium]|nr:DNA adenine methylase [Deltaproteobacteria bacterium]